MAATTVIDHKALGDVEDCIISSNDTVLESIENCVSCVEGVEVQHVYEQKILEDHLTSKQHGLSENEAAVIRRRIADVRARDDKSSFLLDIDDFQLCGENKADDSLARATKNRCLICCEIPEEDFVVRPCCRTGPDICSSCVVLLSSPRCDGVSRICRCLMCCEWLLVTLLDSSIRIVVMNENGQCSVCNQMKSCLVEKNNVCDACFLGKCRALVYECKECRGHQRIPHPMYRYQSSSGDFGNVSWACQLSCQKFTTWKIQLDQVRYIPVGDIPPAWGEDNILIAREKILDARRLVTDSSFAGDFDGASCAIQ